MKKQSASHYSSGKQVLNEFFNNSSDEEQEDQEPSENNNNHSSYIGSSKNISQKSIHKSLGPSKFHPSVNLDKDTKSQQNQSKHQEQLPEQAWSGNSSIASSNHQAAESSLSISNPFENPPQPPANNSTTSANNNKSAHKKDKPLIQGESHSKTTTNNPKNNKKKYTQSQSEQRLYNFPDCDPNREELKLFKAAANRLIRTRQEILRKEFCVNYLTLILVGGYLILKFFILNDDNTKINSIEIIICASLLILLGFVSLIAGLLLSRDFKANTSEAAQQKAQHSKSLNKLQAQQTEEGHSPITHKSTHMILIPQQLDHGFDSWVQQKQREHTESRISDLTYMKILIVSGSLCFLVLIEIVRIVADIRQVFLVFYIYEQLMIVYKLVAANLKKHSALLLLVVLFAWALVRSQLFFKLPDEDTTNACNSETTTQMDTESIVIQVILGASLFCQHYPMRMHVLNCFVTSNCQFENVNNQSNKKSKGSGQEEGLQDRGKNGDDNNNDLRQCQTQPTKLQQEQQLGGVNNTSPDYEKEKSNHIKKMYQDILNVMPEGVALISSSGKLVYANKTLSKIFDCQKSQIMNILLNLATKPKQEGEINPVSPVFQAKKGLITQAKSLKTITAGSPKASSQLSELPSPIETGKHKTSLIMKPSLFNRNRKLSSSEELMLSLQAQNYFGGNLQNQSLNSKDTKRVSGISKTVPGDFASSNTPLADDQTEEKVLGMNSGQNQNQLNSSRQVSTPQQQQQLSQSQQFQSASMTPQGQQNSNSNNNNNNNPNMFYSKKTNDYSDVLSVTNYMHMYPQNGNNNNNSINNGILNIFNSTNNNNNNPINPDTFGQQKDVNADTNSINYQFLEHAQQQQQPQQSAPINQDGNDHFVRKQRSKKFKNTEILKKDLNIKDILASIFDNLKQTQQDQDTKTAKTFKLKKLNSDVTSHQTNTQPNKSTFQKQTSFFSQMKNQQNIGYFQYIDDKVKVEVEYKNTTLVLSMVMCEIVANGFVEQLALVLIDPLWQEMYERKLQDMSNYRMKMFASLSHELRTPLNCSISMLQQLKNSIKEEAEHHLKSKQHQKNANMSIKDKIKQRLSIKKDENSNKSSVFNSQIESVNQKIVESNNSNNVKNTPELRPKGSSIVAATVGSQNVEISHKHARTLEKVNEWTQEYIDPALNSNNLLLNLINDILDFVQIDSGKFKFSFIKFDLEQLLTNCVSMVGIQSKQSTGKVQLELKFDERCPKIINSDPNRIRQIILNFLSNAMKFTAQGCITVSVTLINQKDNKLMMNSSSQSDSPLKIDLLSCIDDEIANNPNDVIEIAVEDQGIGISQEDIDKIFTIFNKIELGNNQSLNSQGCGLGLTISNSIAKGLGPFNQGGIRVQSEIGHGSIFSILVEDREEGLQEHKFSQKEELVKKMATINSLVDSPISQYNKQLQHQTSSFHALDAQLQKQQSSLQQQGKMMRLNSNFTNKTNRTSKTIKSTRTRTKSKSIKAEDSCCVYDSEVNNKNTAQHFTPMAAFQVNSENEMEYYNDISSLDHSQMQMSMHHKTSIYNNNKDVEGSEAEGRSHYRKESSQRGIFSSDNFKGNEDSNRNITSNNNIEGKAQASEVDDNAEDSSIVSNTYVNKIYNKAPLYKTATLHSKTCYRTKTLETIKTEQKDIADAYASYDGIRSSKRNPQKINSSSNPSNSKFGMPSIDSDLAGITPMLGSSKNINKISKRSLLSSQNPLTEKALKSPKQELNSRVDDKDDANNNDKSEDLSAKYILKDGIYRGNPRQPRQAKKKCDCAQILVVDDNMFNMHALSLQLKTYGFLVEQACNGQVAVDIVIKRYNENTCCRTHKVIFMDIEMPIKNGYEATEDIRKFFNGSSLTDKQPIIVACTAYVSDEDKSKALSHGMDDFIKKPVFQEGLDQLLSQWYDVIFEEDTSEFSDSDDEEQGELGENEVEQDQEQSKQRKQSAALN